MSAADITRDTEADFFVFVSRISDYRQNNPYAQQDSYNPQDNYGGGQSVQGYNEGGAGNYRLSQSHYLSGG